MTPNDISKLDEIGEAETLDKAYRAGKIPRREVRRTKDASGNDKRESALVYYGESFEDAMKREQVTS